jgi:hypothetical protein
VRNCKVLYNTMSTSLTVADAKQHTGACQAASIGSLATTQIVRAFMDCVLVLLLPSATWIVASGLLPLQSPYVNVLL